jgi:hypothetical protein
MQEQYVTGFEIPVLMGILQRIMDIMGAKPDWGIVGPTPEILINLCITQHMVVLTPSGEYDRRAHHLHMALDSERAFVIPANAGIGEISLRLERAFNEPYVRTCLDTRVYAFDGMTCTPVPGERITMEARWGS